MGKVVAIGNSGTYSEAEQELESLFHCGASELGLKAQSYDPQQTGGVFAEEESMRAHGRLRHHEHRKAVVDYFRFRATFDAMAPQDRLVARLAYEPRRWTDPPETDRDGLLRRGNASRRLREGLRRTGSNVCLIGVAMVTNAAREAFAAEERTKHEAYRDAMQEWVLARADGLDVPKPHAPAPAPLPHLRMLGFLQDEASREGRSRLLETVRDEANALLSHALRAYDDFRVERVGLELVEHRRASERRRERARSERATFASQLRGRRGSTALEEACAVIGEALGVRACG